MLGRVGIIQKVLAPEEEPEDRWCKAGHHVPDLDCRFLHVSGPDIPPTLAGVYCEDCVTKANRLAKKKKEQRR